MLTHTWEVGGNTPTGQRCSWEEQRSENKQRWGCVMGGRASSSQVVGLERGVLRADSRQATEAVGTFWTLDQPHWSCEILAKCYTCGRKPGTASPPSAGRALSSVPLLSEGCPPSGFGWLEEAQHLLGQMSTQGPESGILVASQRDSIFKPGVGARGKGLQTAVFCLFTNSDTQQALARRLQQRWGPAG